MSKRSAAEIRKSMQALLESAKKVTAGLPKERMEELTKAYLAKREADRERFTQWRLAKAKGQNFRARAAAQGKKPMQATKYAPKSQNMLRDVRSNVSTGQIRNPDREEGVAPERSTRGSGAPLQPEGSLYAVGAKHSKRHKGSAERTIYSYGGHWPVATHMPEHKIVVVHSHDYGGPTKLVVDSLKREVPKIMPGHRIVQVDHPDYQQSASTMKRVAGGDLHHLHEHLSMMAEHHSTHESGDPEKAARFKRDAEHVGNLLANVKKSLTPVERAAQLWCLPQFGDRVMDVEFATAIAKAIEEAENEARAERIRKGLLLVKMALEEGTTLEKSKNVRRQRRAFLEGKRGLDHGAREAEGKHRLDRYMSSIGLEGSYAEPWENDSKPMGTKGPNHLSTTVRGSTGKPEGPHRQQLIHEIGHAQQTPEGSSLKDYQSRLGAPGDRAAAKLSGLGPKEEHKAHASEAGISRRAGLPAFKDPRLQVGSNPGTQDHAARQAAQHNQKLLDAGIHRFDPKTGVKVAQTGVHAQINRRAMGMHNEALATMKQKLNKADDERYAKAREFLKQRMKKNVPAAAPAPAAPTTNAPPPAPPPAPIPTVTPMPSPGARRNGEGSEYGG